MCVSTNDWESTFKVAGGWLSSPWINHKLCIRPVNVGRLVPNVSMMNMLHALASVIWNFFGKISNKASNLAAVHLFTHSYCARPPRLHSARGLCSGWFAQAWLQAKAHIWGVNVSALTGGVVHGSPAVVAEQGGVQVRVCLLQGHTQVDEMVALLVHQHLQKVVYFLSAGRTVLVQFESIELTQGTRDYQKLDHSVRICYGLQ